MDTITVDLFCYLRPPPPPLPQWGSVTTPLESCGFQSGGFARSTCEPPHLLPFHVKNVKEIGRSTCTHLAFFTWRAVALKVAQHIAITGLSNTALTGAWSHCRVEEEEDAAAGFRGEPRVCWILVNAMETQRTTSATTMMIEKDCTCSLSNAYCFFNCNFVLFTFT